MKRLLMVVCITVLLVVFVGCTRSNGINENLTISYNEGSGNESIDRDCPIAGSISGSAVSPVSEVPDILEFWSLAEFLGTHRAYAAGVRSFGELTSLMEDANLRELETLYLPIGIPEAYRLYRIFVSDTGMSFWFLPEEHLVSQRTRSSAMAYGLGFAFAFTRWNYDDPKASMMGQLRGVCESELIDGRYYFDGQHGIEWTTDTERVQLRIPRTTVNAQGQFEIGDGAGGIIALAFEEIPQLAQMQIIDLTNEAEINALLATLPPSHYQLSFDMGVSQANALGTSGVPLVYPPSIDPIDIPVFFDIRQYLRTNHNDFATNPTKEGHTFLGWYLDAGFTMPLASRDEFWMPTRDITLYARWEQAT